MIKNLLEHSFDNFRFQERLNAMEEFQKELAEENKIPDTDKLLLRKYKVHLQYTGGILLASSISVFSVLLNFVLFNMIIHI